MNLVQPFHKIASVQLPEQLVSPEAYPDPSWLWSRLTQVASAARALDPSLGVLRCIKRGPVEQEERLATPFQIVFTQDDRAKLPFRVIEDENAVDFWEGVSKVLPAAFVASEQARWNLIPAMQFANATDAAIFGAFKAMRLSFNANHDLGVVDGVHRAVTTSSAVTPGKLEFMNSPDLARIVLLTEPLPSEEDGYRSPAAGMRRNIQMLRDKLAKPFAETPEADKTWVAQTLRSLGPRHLAHETFELTHDHGFVAYALAHGGADWTPFLLQDNLCHPTATYNGVSPLAVAIAQNNGEAVHALMSTGLVSANVLMYGWPNVFDASLEEHFRGLEETMIPPLGFAAAIGAAKAAAALLKHGADPDMTSGQHRTPLFLAAVVGDETVAKVLISHGADASRATPPTIELPEGILPEQIVPEGDEFTSLYNYLARHRKEAELAQQKASAPAPSPQEKLAAARTARSAQPPAPSANSKPARPAL